MERRTSSWCEACAEAKVNLGDSVLLNQRKRLRDRASFDLAIDSKLRGCDLVRLKIGDVVSGGTIRTLAMVIQKKTGRPVQFELLPDARSSLLAWLQRRGGTVGDFVFPSRVDRNGHLSIRLMALSVTHRLFEKRVSKVVTLLS